MDAAVPDFVKDVAVKITPAEQIYTAAALAAGYNRPAAAETAQIEGESSC